MQVLHAAGGGKKTYLLLSAHGLAEEAQALVRRNLATTELDCCALPRPADGPGVNEGHAAVDQTLLTSGDVIEPDTLRQLPGIVAPYAFVALACGVHGQSSVVLAALTELVSTLRDEFEDALSLTYFSKHVASTRTLPRFRVSVVRDGHHDFTSEEAARALGSGVVQSLKWPCDMKRYDVEVFCVIHADHISVGLTCHKLGDDRLGATRGSVLPAETRSWNVSGMRHMRFSTARSLLEFGRVGCSERLLDLTGGVGTIAIEAATCFSNLVAISSDSHNKSCTAARTNLEAAMSMGLILDGSSVQVQCAKCESFLDSAGNRSAFDVVVSELPFGVGCKRLVPLGVLLDVLSFVLRPKSGRAALLVPVNAEYNDIAKRASEHRGLWSQGTLLRPGNVGGLRVQVVLLFRSAVDYASDNTDVHIAAGPPNGGYE